MTASLRVPACPTCGSLDVVPTFEGDMFTCHTPDCRHPEPFAVSVSAADTLDTLKMAAGGSDSDETPPGVLSRVVGSDGAIIARLVLDPYLPGVRTLDSYVLPDDLSYDQWASIVTYLGAVSGAVNWWYGDAVLTGLERWGDDAYQSLGDDVRTAAGRSLDWLEQIMLVARSYPPGTRVPGMTWSHHRAVMLNALPAPERIALLEAAAEEEREGGRVTTREIARRAQGQINVIQGDIIDIPPDDTDDIVHIATTAEMWQAILDGIVLTRQIAEDGHSSDACPAHCTAFTSLIGLMSTLIRVTATAP